MPKRIAIAALGCFAFGVFLFLHTLLWSDGWQRRQRARADLAALTAENAAQAVKVERLRSDIEALRTRKDVQERVVRRELGYARPGDLVLELETTGR